MEGGKLMRMSGLGEVDGWMGLGRWLGGRWMRRCKDDRDRETGDKR